MRYFYLTLPLELAAFTDGSTPFLSATTTNEYKITGIWCKEGASYDTFLLINGRKVYHIPRGFTMGFQRMIPFDHDLRKGEVAYIGFKNHTATPSTLLFTIQYYKL